MKQCSVWVGVLVLVIGGQARATPDWLMADLDGTAMGQAFGYVSPNEFHPSRTLPILSRAQAGAYIGVGADRTFNFASLSPRIDRMVCIDSDPSIVTFNLFNVFLLQASQSIEDYRHLRLNAQWSEILTRLKKIRNSVHPRIVDAISETNLGLFRREFMESGFQILHEPQEPDAEKIRRGSDEGFWLVNYIHREEQYQRLKRLADAGRIEVHVANLKDLNFMSSLAQRVGNRLSVLDLSNAWGSAYAGEEATSAVLRLFKDRNPEALFMYSSLIPKSDPYDFNYGAITLKNIELLHEMLYARKTPRLGTFDGVPLRQVLQTSKAVKTGARSSKKKTARNFKALR